LIVSQYAAGEISVLWKYAGFKEVVERRPDFMEDLFERWVEQREDHARGLR
jgi:hypothetical protein